MFYVISYDITDNKRRNKVAKILKDYGKRVQFSVFECDLDKKLFEKLTSKLTDVIDKNEDSIRIYLQCEACLSKVGIIGQGMVTQTEEVFIV